jgi:hypothetical protein
MQVKGGVGRRKAGKDEIGVGLETAIKKEHVTVNRERDKGAKNRGG